MKIVSSNIYVGPNIYAHFPVIRHVLDLEELEHWPTGKLGKSFVEPLLESMPKPRRNAAPRWGRCSRGGLRGA